MGVDGSELLVVTRGDVDVGDEDLAVMNSASYPEITWPDVTEYQAAVEDVFETGDELVEEDEDRLA